MNKIELARITKNLRILLSLAGDNSINVKLEVLRNKYITWDILDKLSRDINSQIRCNVAIHPCSNQTILARLSTDDNFGVRANIATNPNTSSILLDDIAHKEELKGGYVHEKIAQNPLTFENTIRYIFTCLDISSLNNTSFSNLPIITFSILRNYNTPSDVLTSILNINKDVYSYLVARHHNTPTELLLQFSQNKKYHVDLIYNTKCPIDIIENLNVNDPDVKIALIDTGKIRYLPKNLQQKINQELPFLLGDKHYCTECLE